MSRVGLFFGSFNPIHNGHVEIAKFVLDKGLVDEVWLVVSPQNPHKSLTELLAVEHRLKMVQLAVEDLNAVTVSNVELTMPVPSYTVDTLGKLRTENPQNDFIILMGGDNLASFPRWKQHEEILAHHRILCYSRAGSEQASLSDHPNVSILDGPLLDRSSTEIREDLIAGRDIDKKVPSKVVKYMTDRTLFD